MAFNSDLFANLFANFRVGGRVKMKIIRYVSINGNCS